MRRSSVLRGIAGIALTAGLVLPVVLLPVEAQAADVVIKAVDSEFQPQSRTINPGSRIQWRSPDCANSSPPCSTSSHSVTFQNGPSIDVEMSPGGSTQFYTFSTAGTYQYYCKFHGDPDSRIGMVGTIIVSTGSTSSPTSSATPTRTITITTSASPKPKPTKSATKSPTSSASASPSLSPSPSLSSPSPSPTPTTESPTPTTTTSQIDEGTPTATTPAGSSGNTQAILAIGGVIVLGALGFFVYRRTLRT